jgi:clan AA aspartic protease
MGITHVTVAVANPTNPDRRWGGLFRVDTGATDCRVPASRLREVGIEPRGKRAYELADGSELSFQVGVAQIEFMGDTVGATVIFGEEDCEPILGVAALESAGIEVDPVSRRLKRLPAVRLKGLRRAGTGDSEA